MRGDCLVSLESARSMAGSSPHAWGLLWYTLRAPQSQYSDVLAVRIRNGQETEDIHACGAEAGQSLITRHPCHAVIRAGVYPATNERCQYVAGLRERQKRLNITLRGKSVRRRDPRCACTRQYVDATSRCAGKQGTVRKSSHSIYDGV